LGKYEWAGNPDVGDCSLRILSGALEYDDGEWECQVTASDFAAQDALTSRPVKLVVRGKTQVEKSFIPIIPSSIIFVSKLVDGKGEDFYCSQQRSGYLAACFQFQLLSNSSKRFI